MPKAFIKSGNGRIPKKLEKSTKKIGDNFDASQLLLIGYNKHSQTTINKSFGMSDGV